VDHISLVGEYGQGKSTALLAFCANWAREWIKGRRDARIPLLIELRGKSPKRQAPDRFLAEWGDRFGLRGDALLSLIQAGRAILIFEGFDEVQDAGLRYDRFEQFRALWSFSYPGTKIIFTGRPNFFLDTNERVRLLRSSPAARDAGLLNSRVMSLSFLDLDGIASALRKYPSALRDEILAQCYKDPAFLQIARRPSMLPVLGNQWERIRNQITTHHGITSASIIEYFIEFLYSRKDADRDKLGKYNLLHHKVRHYFTQCIVWQMVTANLGNTVDQNRFVLGIEDGYRKLDAQFRGDTDADPDVASSIADFHERFKDRPTSEIIAAIATDVRAGGLFAPDPASGRDNFYFPHKQYFEFIIGRLFVGRIVNNDRNYSSWITSLPISSVVDAANNEPVSIFFASGLLDVTSVTKKRIVCAQRLIQYTNSYQAYIWSAILLIMARFSSYSHLVLTARIVRECPFDYRYLAMELRFGRGAFRNGALVSVAPICLVFLTRFWNFGNYSLRSIDTDLIFFTVSILFWFVPLLAAISSFSGQKLRLSDCFDLMELYRNGSIERVARHYGKRAHAAVVLLLHSRLPVGAVRLPTDLVNSAADQFGIGNLDEIA